jgi:hypothetical protein
MKKGADKPDSFFRADVVSLLQDKEIIDFLDSNIKAEFRECYLKLKHGLKIPKQQLLKLKAHILLIMEESQWNQLKFHENEDN